MGMRVDKPGQDCASGEVNFPGTSGREVENILIRSDRKNAITGDGDGLSSRIRRIDGEDVRSVQNQARLESSAPPS
jgi:hypothetical protein